MAKASIRSVDPTIEQIEAILKSGIRGNKAAIVSECLARLRDSESPVVAETDYGNAVPGEIIRDPKRPGLWLKVGKRTKSWLYRYKNGPQTVEVHLGYYPDMSTEAARGKWQELSDLRQSGGDPKTESKDSGSRLTCKELASKYLTEYAIRKRDKGRSDGDILYRDFVPVFGDRPAESVTRKEFQSLVDQVSGRTSKGKAGQKLLAAVRKMYNEAIKKEWINSTVNPCKNVESSYKPKKMGEGVHLNEKQLKVFLSNLPKANMPEAARVAIRLMLSTVSRPSEICELLWEEVDLEAGVITLPGMNNCPKGKEHRITKNGRSHRVMLSRQDVRILKGWQEKTGQQSGVVFGSLTNKTRHIDISWLAARLADNREFLGVGGHQVTPHTMRHTATTLLAGFGVFKEVRDRITNHIVFSTDGIYNSFEYDKPARDALQLLSDHLEKVEA